MRRVSIQMTGLLAAAILLGASASASASTATIGSAVEPVGASIELCGTSESTYFADLDPAANTVQARGEITAWQIGTLEAAAEAPVTFMVLKPSAGQFQVLGTDTETLPNPLPESDVASFTLASPIAVESGDLIALRVPVGSKVVCYYYNGATPGDGVIIGGKSAVSPSTGETIEDSFGPSPAGYVVNLAASFEAVSAVLALSTAVAPVAPTAGQLAEFDSTIANSGGEASSVTFSERIPAGLTISQAVAGSGTCSVSAQVVTCAITTIAAGASDPVVVTVVPSEPGSYASTATVSSPSVAAPVPARESASATLTVAAAPAAPAAAAKAKCRVPVLTGVPLKIAENVLKLLGCNVGKLEKHSARKVRKGDILATKPGAGSYAAGAKIILMTSSGPPKKGKAKKAAVTGA